jgi:lipopolysaccharide/colanic/teichoic acid biosynthesis glycosyltransferase
LITQGSIATRTPRTVPRARQRGRFLVVGDERVRRLAYEAHGRSWRVVPVDLEAPPSPVEADDELILDAASLDWVRGNRPELLQGVRRVWMVTEEHVQPEEPRDPFESPLPAAGRVFKRALDIVLALVGLLLVLPVLLLTMLAVRLDSPGPALFRQIRVGTNGRRFQLYKLRTMRHGNDDRAHREYVAQLINGNGERQHDLFKLVDDPRITRIGRMLRKLSIDELPQLWNVLTGDMSLVGPRPPLPHEVELYPASAWDRLRVKPGVTGLWQISGRCELSFEQMVALDVRYWRRWTPLSDIRIILKTPRTVLSRRGAA